MTLDYHGPVSAVARVALLVLAAAACNPAKTSFQLGVPGTGVEMSVARVKPRGGFLDTELRGSGGFTLRTFLPASALCQHVIAGEAGIQYAAGGSYGTLVRGEERCVASGIGSLREWRNRRPRPSNELIPSAQATFSVVYRDEQVTFLRGNFPLAGFLGFTDMGDAIAVVPNTAECLRPIERGVSTLEYFHAGRNVLTLSSSQGRCNIEGLIRPLAEADVEP